MAVKDAIKNGFDPKGSTLYLYGHWWCCQDCWQEMIDKGVKYIYLLDKSWEVFNQDNKKI
jgi:hypothetical protein